MLNKIKNISNQTKTHYILIIIICLIQVILITKFNYIFGSNTDWLKQHATFPEYFRQLFYQTGDLFPDFALHLGGGQNIFYFAYYGLYNPIILLSYLLPFIPMEIYIIISSIAIVIISVLLFYYFLKKNNFSNNICLFTSLLFLTSSSLLFHSHRHIMFINYMPFLILGLIGINRYFNKKRSDLLILSVFLMILTSYYYSIPGIIVLCLYGLFYYLKTTSNITLKNTIKEGLLFILRIVLGILLASILLLPVAYVILNGRTESNIILNITHFIPKIKLNYLMYGTYGIGLTCILWITIIYNLLYLKKEYKIITVLLSILLLFPIINLLLNGGLYLNGKIFIPFLPLLLLFIASMIKDIKEHQINWKWLFLIVTASALILIEIDKKQLYIFIEIILTLILLFLYQKHKKILYLTPIIILSFIISISNNTSDNLITINDYQKHKEYYNYDVLNYLNNNTDSIYRYQDDLSEANGINSSYAQLDYRTSLYSSTSNINYWNSFYNTFNNNDIYRNHFMLDQTNNIFFQRFMGIRYLLTNNNPPYNYNKIKEYKNGTLYENNTVYPIGFSSSNLLNKNEYNDLSYIEKLLAHQNNIIIDGKSDNSILDNKYEKIALDYKITSKENINIKKENNHYIINSQENGNITLKLNEPITNKTLIIRFKMNDIPSCKNGDTYIAINNIMNKLTCKTWKYYNGNETFDYVLSSNNDINELQIEFAKGTYDISDIEVYSIDNTLFDNNRITPLIIDYNNTKGNKLSGTINQQEDGYFMFTIPYDDGFTILVDDKEVEIKKVNDAFIGFQLEKGTHNIELAFNAPYSNLGKTITIITSFIYIGVIIIEKKRSRNN